MKVEKTKINDLLIIQPELYKDSRGFFVESWNEKAFRETTKHENFFLQDNHSKSAKNVLRGLHYQLERPQGKLVRVISGRIFDVAVDVRLKSNTFGKYFGIELSSRNKKQLWIPRGFAHGFITLSQKAEVLYKVDEIYFPDLEKTILWNDEELSINWPISKEPLLSEKDKKGISFANFKGLL